MTQTRTLKNLNQLATTVRDLDVTGTNPAVEKTTKNPKTVKMVLGAERMAQTNLAPARTTMKPITGTTVTELKDSQKLFAHFVRHVGKQTTLQKDVNLEPMQPTDCFPGTNDRKHRMKSSGETPKTVHMKTLKPQSKI